MLGVLIDTGLSFPYASLDDRAKKVLCIYTYVYKDFYIEPTVIASIIFCILINEKSDLNISSHHNIMLKTPLNSHLERELPYVKQSLPLRSFWSDGEDRFICT